MVTNHLRSALALVVTVGTLPTTPSATIRGPPSRILSEQEAEALKGPDFFETPVLCP